MIKKSIFLIFFFTGIVVISFLFIPSFFLPQKIALYGGKLMGYWTGFCLNFFLSTKITVKGKENIILNQKFFIASSHQSMFETFYLQTLFNSPIFILKKELLFIPLFGWYLKKIGSISIKRNKISKGNLDFYENISQAISITNRPIIIFPQGTRVLPHERPPFKKGASKIYEKLKISCQPIAINSGYVWPKTGINQSHKSITISILKPISAHLPKDEFLKILEDHIYSELDLLN
ncbi:1-acyl-sn-glycerol-3-phosphate acyltransferase [Candidatus Pelagibacter sp.]|nr:1-acyl-sn-glycerol-3-phosphate acyltransferase [Candidatus Pelagibacter sp.]|tara:strand:- start:418 stop:1119 length:702 start_codon:yes stop_codon:yes gene_type:complete